MFETTKNNTGLTITKYTGNDKNVVIPEQIDGVTVTRIGHCAFHDNKLENVVIPDSVTRIGNWAFSNNKLENIVIPDSVTHIGYSAFGYNKLENIVIPDSVTHIDNWAFSNNKLENIVILNSVTHIGAWAFSYNELQNIVIPDSVTHIGFLAFGNNEPLKQINGQTARCIDNFAMLIDSTKQFANGLIHKCRYFPSKKSCYVAEQTVEDTVYTAHGETIRQAVADLRFKILRLTANLDDVVSEIKRKQTVSVHEYRLITGACQKGCELFLQQNGIEANELPLDRVLTLVETAYGGSRFRGFFG